MIIECKSCLKKFTIRDSDIPSRGRTVQCGNCSTRWLQMPIVSQTTTQNLKINDEDQDLSKISSSATPTDSDENNEEQKYSKDKFKASDGKNYKYLGSQWAEVLPSGKFGKLARKKISTELNKLSGKKKSQKSKTTNRTSQPTDQYHETQGGMGIFSFLIVLVIFGVAIILALDTFKNQLIPFFPNLENYLLYIFETLNNIYIIIKDLINNYK